MKIYPGIYTIIVNSNADMNARPSGRSPVEIVGSNPPGGVDLVQRNPTDCGVSLCVI
jgi:hypothetical protein